jgi:hypothetical protein
MFLLFIITFTVFFFFSIIFILLFLLRFLPSPSTSRQDFRQNTSIYLQAWGWYNRPVVAAVPSGLSLTPLTTIKNKRIPRSGRKGAAVMDEGFSDHVEGVADQLC